MGSVLAAFNRIKVLISFIILFFVSIQFSESNAQTTKVLFIGSSLTAFNQQPVMFAQLAQASGRDVLVENGAILGKNLTDHLSINITLERLTQENWDYVVLENGDYGLMSDQTKYNVWSTIDDFIELIHANNSATKIIFFMDWAMKYGVNQDGVSYTYSEFQQKIYDATLEIANHKNLIVAPIGSAWKEIIESSSDLELYASDNGHPSLLGSYLGACVYYSVIFEESVEGNTYYNTIDEQDALYLQSIASSTVLENLGLWNLITSVEDYTSKKIIDTSFDLFQNYPNPFNPATTIQFELNERSVVDLEVFNSLGMKVSSILDNKELSSGTHNYQWNGCDNLGNKLSSGIYFYRLKTNMSSKTRSMIMLK